MAFIPASDVGAGSFECDIWAQDCPAGMKCMWWADDGGPAWNALRCFDVVDDPNGVGEPCTVVDSQVSGIDDCDYRSMCWEVDPDTLMGTCRSLCHGSEAYPTCDDPCETCPIGGSGFFVMCLPSCDPVVQDCRDDYGCYPQGEGFQCFADASGDSGAPGEPCEFPNVCDPGSACIGAELVPECQGSGCCSPFCDLAAADDCAASIPGTVCTPWFSGGQSNGCVAATVGVCAVP
ncbi:MAG: ribulose phosphate epimerase [Deltaproteobacteria bacterium]|nr:ribulose phosphate epimerase [Nannocystaceae bacterium]